jgi:hypothetical protein
MSCNNDKQSDKDVIPVHFIKPYGTMEVQNLGTTATFQAPEGCHKASSTLSDATIQNLFTQDYAFLWESGDTYRLILNLGPRRTPVTSSMHGHSSPGIN